MRAAACITPVQPLQAEACIFALGMKGLTSCIPYVLSIHFK
ncbi:hypothetical protein AB205_0163140 [Aquarana catesbeiana]|uniref:Uncharacterized protein n=1 Tax=Aquarana catesbeiana TaxID=8400 RepID=A0A2G9S4G9_AQUCT|nr:hypothetical protein AB205_0163140 [Aquarana catesbeiana]